MSSRWSVSYLCGGKFWLRFCDTYACTRAGMSRKTRKDWPALRKGGPALGSACERDYVGIIRGRGVRPTYGLALGLTVLIGCLENIASKNFLTWEGISRDADNENLEDRQMNICVSEPSFEFLGNSEQVLKYKSVDQQLAHIAIRLCRRMCFRQMGVKVSILFLILCI